MDIRNLIKKRKVVLFCVLGVLLIVYVLNSKNSFSISKGTVGTVSEDGAWCWFSDPRAIYLHGDRVGVQTGWVTSKGDIQAGFIGDNGKIITQVLADKLDKDDHANPAFAQLTNGEKVVFYTKHFDSKIRYHKMQTNSNDSLFGAPLEINPFDSLELKKFPLKRTTYANPFVLEEEDGKLFCFGRWTGFKPNMMWSTDQGKTFSKSKVVVTNYPFDAGNRPYVKYYSDGKSRIHMVFTDGHPRNEPLNSVYYAYYEKGAFWKVDGTKICTVDELPFEPKDASVVYKANKKSGRSWVYDLAADDEGHPVILYARYPEEKKHLYHYAKFNGVDWVDVFICNSGKWFEETPRGRVEPEPHYSGGMTVNPLNTNVIYTSETINEVFEIVRYELDNQGNIKKREFITSNSQKNNVRPYIPRNIKKYDPEIVLWMENEKYVHYTEYKSAIKYYSY